MTDGPLETFLPRRHDAPTMLRRLRTATLLPLLSLVTLVTATACDENRPLAPDESVEPLVGQWDAIELIFTPPEGAGSPVDVMATGAMFFLDVQPSGTYTAYLTMDGATSTEIGRLDVTGNHIVMEADYPAPGRSTGIYQLNGDRLTIRGETETALGVPGTTSVVEVLMVFERRED